MAPFLARSTLVHYTTWVTLGISFSLVFLTYLMQKRLRHSFFSWVFLAYILSLYMMTTSWYNITTLLSTSTLPWLLAYCLVTGLVSWATLYRLGPPSHPRTIHLIQWTLQGFSLIMLVMSSYNTMVSICIASILLLWSVVPPGIMLGVVDFISHMLSRPKVTRFTSKLEF